MLWQYFLRVRAISSAVEREAFNLCVGGSTPSWPTRICNMIVVLVILSIVLFLLLIFSLYFTIAGLIGAPFIPTRKKYVEQMLDDVGLRSGERFVDLGAGDGRLVLSAARRGAYAIGYEMNPFLVAIAQFRIWKNRRAQHARVYWKSLWGADLRNVDVVSIYGITNIMPRLEKKFLQELRGGARVVSFTFPLPTWQPTQVRGRVRIYTKQ